MEVMTRDDCDAVMMLALLTKYCYCLVKTRGCHIRGDGVRKNMQAESVIGGWS
jgi:hypothetical protein